MRKICFIFSMLVMGLTIQAKPIEQQRAHDIAAHFLSASTHDRAHTRGGAPALTLQETGLKHLYTFADKNGGFVVVADDDRIEPVLAYSETATFDPQDLPQALRLMLASYDRQIGSLADSPAGTREAETSAAREVIAPLIKTVWHQYLPLNYACPFDQNTGRNTLVGCVALTLAQLMYYYQYPQATTIAIPAYTTGTGYNMPELPTTTFDYGKMQLNYDIADTREEVDANDQSIAEVNKLLMYAGCAVQMNYSVNGSAAVFDTEAFAQYFGFDKGARRLLARNYSHENWEEMVYQELKAGRPVPYSAGAIGNQTHEFIIDGYDGKGFFHANIGEIGRGNFNSFFRLGVLNPYEDQTSQVEFSGYNVNQMAVFGFQPDQGNDTGVNEEPLPMAEPNVKVERVTYFAAYEGEKLDVRAWITNEGTAYENLLTLWIDGVMRTGVGAYIDPGQTDYVDFCTAAPTVGSHVVTIATDMEGQKVVYTGELSVSEAPACQLEAQTEVKGIKGKKIQGQLDVTCEITNTGETTYDNMVFVNIEINKDNGEGGLIDDVPNGIPAAAWKRIWYIHLAPGERTTISFSVGKEAFKAGDYLYGISINYYNNKWRYGNLYSNGYFKYVDEETSAISSTRQDTAAGNDTYDLKGRRVSAAERKRGIYISNGKKVIVK